MCNCYCLLSFVFFVSKKILMKEMTCSSEDAKWNRNPCWFVCLWVISIDFSNISCWFGVWFRFRFENFFTCFSHIFIKIVHYSLLMSYLNYYYFIFFNCDFCKMKYCAIFQQKFFRRKFLFSKNCMDIISAIMICLK